LTFEEKYASFYSDMHILLIFFSLLTELLSSPSIDYYVSGYGKAKAQFKVRSASLEILLYTDV